MIVRMRGVLALGCCVVYLAFGFVAGAAHVHEAADHHEQMRGLHLDHAHLGHAADHASEHHHGHESPEDGDAGVDPRHVGHHVGDALYLTATALRSPGTGPSVLPATVAAGATIDTPSKAAGRIEELPVQLRAPPRAGPTHPRAPPA